MRCVTYGVEYKLPTTCFKTYPLCICEQSLHGMYQRFYYSRINRTNRFPRLCGRPSWCSSCTCSMAVTVGTCSGHCSCLLWRCSGYAEHPELRYECVLWSLVWTKLFSDAVEHCWTIEYIFTLAICTAICEC